MFDISLGSKDIFFGESGYNGKIMINAHEENFFSNDSFFDAHQYKSHWLKASDHFLLKKKAYFLTNVYNPRKANFFNCWYCCLIGDEVCVQNRLIFSYMYNLEKIISLQCNIGDMDFFNENGDKISTWRTDFKSMVEFNKKMLFFIEINFFIKIFVFFCTNSVEEFTE